MSRFLPPSVQDYAIPAPKKDDFTGTTPDLLEDVGRKMRVTKAGTDGRVPTPFSRAFSFYLDLYGKGLEVVEDSADPVKLDQGRMRLREAARAAFRGVLAFFALRDALGVEVSRQVYRLAKGDNMLKDALFDSVAATPVGSEFWNPIRLYLARNLVSSELEVLAGASPLTGIYPSAVHPKLLRSVYWYDAETGDWYDPTSSRLDSAGELQVSSGTSRKVRRYLKAWLENAIDRLKVEAASLRETVGLGPFDQTLFIGELELWMKDMTDFSTDGTVVREKPMRSEGPNEPDFTILNLVVDANPEEIISELPIIRGTLVCTREQLLDNATRLYGRQYGSKAFGARIRDIPPRGEDLGLALGLGEHIAPIRYVVVDKLFTPRLSLITQSGLSSGWTGLEIDGGQFLLPFKPEIFEILSPEELLANLSAELDQKGENYIVRLELRGKTIRVNYSVRDKGDYVADSITLDESFDLRLFPFLDLDRCQDLLDPEDRKYYARVVQGPDWDFEIGAFRLTDGGEIAGPKSRGQSFVETATKGVTNEATEPGYFRTGQHLVMTMSQKPRGFFAEGMGLCLVDLPAPQGGVTDWRIGVDFGTSNTCVTYRTDAMPDAAVLDLPVLTTTLLRKPRHDKDFAHPSGTPVNEGASAVLDFFYRHSEADHQLKEEDYFPTQVVTTYEQVQDTAEWDFDNGLVFFRNIGLSASEIWQLIRGFVWQESAAQDVLAPRPRFWLRQDIKWQETAWLETFMRHLRRQIVMSAARRGGKLSQAHFSYPKAFGKVEQNQFNSILDRVWAPLKPDLRSESEAIRDHVVKHANEHVVIDVGGGTTDIIAFSSREPVFQTSFRLAAGQVNQYVVQSPDFRRVFLEAVNDVLGKETILPDALSRGFTKQLGETGYNPQLIATVWLALLEELERHSERALSDVLFQLRGQDNDRTDEQELAVTGFFTTIVLLFASIAYHGGYLLGLAGVGGVGGAGGFNTDFIRLVLAGNGAKLYRMIDFEGGFKNVVRELVRVGFEAGARGQQSVRTEEVTFDGLFKLPNGKLAPKTAVALGLLKSSAQGASSEVPVARVVGEEGFLLGGKEVGADFSLADYYKGVADGVGSEAPQRAPTNLASMLETLEELLPKGVLDGFPVIPRAGISWTDRYKNSLYWKSRLQIRTRVDENARRLSEELKTMTDDQVSALEPLFIVQVASLLDRIREDDGMGR